MSHKYISWPVGPVDLLFRQIYAAETGEIIQPRPLLDSAGVRYLAGSARLTEQQSQNLLENQDLAGNIYIGDEPPQDWISELPLGE